MNQFKQMLASYQFVPSKLNDEAPQKMGGGFRFRYKSAYAKHKVTQASKKPVQKQNKKPKLTMEEINQAMNQLLDKDSSTSQHRNVITKPVGVDFEQDFRKLASATESVKQTLEIVSQVQRFKPFVEINQEAPNSEIQSQPTSLRQVIQASKFQTTEAANFISNATLRPTPDSSVTPGYQDNFLSAKLQNRRPYSGGNPCAPDNRLIDTEKLDEKNYKDDQKKGCGTLTPLTETIRVQELQAASSQLNFRQGVQNFTAQVPNSCVQKVETFWSQVNDCCQQQDGGPIHQILSGLLQRNQLTQVSKSFWDPPKTQELAKKFNHNFISSSTVLELQNSQSKSKKKLFKSNSSTTKNADIENILKQSQSVNQCEEDIQRLKSSQELEVPQQQNILNGDNQQTPESTQHDYTLQQNLPEQHAIGVQTPLSNQFTIPIVSEQQIGHTALLSNKTNFSHIAWNISFMKQDSYDPLNSKEKLSHLISDRGNQADNSLNIISQQMVPQNFVKDFRVNSDHNSFVPTQSLKKQTRPTTSRPTLINLNSHHNIETAFEKQTREREMIRTLSTAQVNKLSIGAIQSSNQLLFTLKNSDSNLKSKQRQNTQASVQAKSNSLRNTQKFVNLKSMQEQLNSQDQPVKIQLVLSQFNQENFKFQPVIPQLNNYNIKVQGKQIHQIKNQETAQIINGNTPQEMSLKTQNQNCHKNNLDLQDQNLVTKADYYTTQSHKQTKEFLKPKITSHISVKHSPKKGKTIKYDITNHFESNIKQVQPLKKSNQQKDQLDIAQSLNLHQELRTTDIQEAEVTKTKVHSKQNKNEQWRLLPNTPFTELHDGFIIDQTHIGALNPNSNSIPSNSKTPKNLLLQSQKTSPQQRKSFTAKVAQLAKIINAQSEADQVQFQIKYENLMQKHSRKSWLPDTSIPQATDDRLIQKANDKIKPPLGDDKTQNTSGLQKALNAKIRPHPLAFLELQVTSKADQPLAPIQIVKVTRPKTTKTSCRVALIQEKEAPLPPPSVKDQKRIGANINFLRKSDQFVSQKQQPGLSLIDLRMSNYQLLLTTSQPQTSQVTTPTEPKYFQEKTLLQENSKTRKQYNGQVREGTANSKLFRKVTHTVE